ncbi:Uncharacterised protein [Vibrio cholerae]|nr:Uncharacterised protein [Vibrio cholerae]
MLSICLGDVRLGVSCAIIGIPMPLCCLIQLNQP